MKLDDKLYLVRFNTDKLSHIKIANPNVCLQQCQDKPCTRFARLMFMIGTKKKNVLQLVMKDALSVAPALSGVPLGILTGSTLEVDSEFPGKMGNLE